MYFSPEILEDLDRRANTLRAMVKTIERYMVEAPHDSEIAGLMADKAEAVGDRCRSLVGCLERVGRIANEAAASIRTKTLGNRDWP